MSLLLVDGSVAADSPPVPASLVFRRNSERYPAGSAFSIKSTFDQLADPIPYQFVARLIDQVRFNPQQPYYTQPRFDPITCDGPLSAGAGADDAGFGNVPWINPGNITVSDNVYAVASIGTFGSATPSHYLISSSHGFAIPGGATITGITLEIERKDASASGTITDSRVRIVKGGVIGSTDKASATVWPNADAYQTYGSSTDLWGTTWTPSDINASNFGAALSAGSSSSPPVDASVDHFRITVCYTGAVADAAKPPAIYSQTRDSRPVPITQAVYLRSTDDPVVVPGALLQVPIIARESQRSIPQGRVIAIKTDGPEEEHVGLPRVAIFRQAEKPGFGGSYYLWSTELLTPILAGDSRQVAIIARQGERPLPMGSIQFLRTDGPIPESVGLPEVVIARQAQRPGDGGRAIVLGTEYPAINAPRPSIVSKQSERPRETGKAQLISSPPPPSVRIPSGQTLVFRDLPRMPARGRATVVRSTGTDLPSPSRTIAKPLPQIPPSVIGGRSIAMGSRPEPRPAPPIAIVARQPQRTYLPGSVLFLHSIATAQPPGSLLPKPYIAKQAQRPGFGGLAIIMMQDLDAMLPPGCPFFTSETSSPFVSVAKENYNSDGPNIFTGRDRCT